MQRRWSDSDAEFGRAIKLNPKNAVAHYFCAFDNLVPQKRRAEAEAEFRKALSLDPLSSIVNANFAVALEEIHRYPEALAEFQKNLGRDPNSLPTHHKLGQFYASTGRFADAVSECQKSLPQPIAVAANAQGYIECEMAHRGGVRSAAVALAYSASGDRAHAFEYLEKAYADEDIELLIVIRSPAFDPPRTDARYKDLMKRLGLPE